MFVRQLRQSHSKVFTSDTLLNPHMKIVQLSKVGFPMSAIALFDFESLGRMNVKLKKPRQTPTLIGSVTILSQSPLALSYDTRLRACNNRIDRHIGVLSAQIFSVCHRFRGTL